MEKIAKVRLIFYVSIMLISNGLYGQTSSRNFIAERTYKLATNTVSDDINTASRQINYIDGLGRPLQAVSVSASPEITNNTPSDLVMHTEYDSQGRLSKKIAPYPAIPSILSGSGGFKDDAITQSIAFYNNPANFCDNNGRAYALTEYELSPLNRISKQYSVGSDKAVEFYYGLNTNEVKRYDVTKNATTGVEELKANGNYEVNQLTYTETRDENGHDTRVREYLDKNGRMILKRSYNGDNEQSTYYVYDDLSLLRFVLQPQYQDDGILDKFAFKYTYNAHGLIATKYIPGGGTTTLEYDTRDRLVRSTDGRGIVSYIKYDDLNRVVETGQMTGAVENALVKTYYDTYPTGIEAFVSNGEDYPSSVNANVKGQVTVISTRVLAATGIYNPDDVWLTTVRYYDDRYNVIQTVRNLYDLGGTAKERVSRLLRFDGRLEKEFIGQEVPTGNNSVEKFFTYDYADRPTSTRYLIKKNGTIRKHTTLLGSTYDALGQLKIKFLHSPANDGVYRERLDYCFTPRSLLSQVIGKTNGIENFGVQLKYDFPANGAGPQYNGNIAEMLWKRGSSWMGYRFTYDGPKRLVYAEGFGGNTNRENVTYDKNGNITTLQRAFDGVQKDNLSYNYYGNQLTSVTDAENNPEGFNNGNSGMGTDYFYDGNGNAISDANRNISTDGIVYSVHNLVQQVTISGGATLTYRYDGTGAKLRMENFNGAVNTKYAGDFEYDKNNYLTRIATEEGQIIITNNGATNNDYAFEYYLKDHLGNTRMVMNEAGTMIQETEYFPFGLAIPKISGSNKYLYNGKEKQPETGWLDYGARQYDPTIGRWMVVDPESEGQDEFSPYHYSFDNPIRFSDPDGRFPDCCGEWGAAAKGFAVGVSDAVVRNVRAVTIDLPQTIEGLANFATPAGKVEALVGATMLYQQTKNDWNTGDVGTRANIVGNVVGEVAIAFAGTKGAGNVGKVGEAGNVLSRSERIAVLAEANAGRRLAEMEAANPGAHFVSRHGVSTTMADQQVRALTGVTPDGVVGRPAVDASKFSSNLIQLQSAQRAQTIFSQTGKSAFSFNMGQSVGSGFIKNTTTVTGTPNVQAIFRNNNLYTMFPKLR